MSIAELPLGSDVAWNAVRDAVHRGMGAGTAGIIVKLDGTRVILYGIAESSAARVRAEKLARAVAGVTEVTNYLLIRQPEPDSTTAQPDAATVSGVGVLTR